MIALTGTAPVAVGSPRQLMGKMTVLGQFHCQFLSAYFPDAQ